MTKIKNIQKTEIQNKKAKLDKKVSFSILKQYQYVERKDPVTKNFSYRHKDTVRTEYSDYCKDNNIDLLRDDKPKDGDIKYISNNKWSRFLLELDDEKHKQIENKVFNKTRFL